MLCKMRKQFHSFLQTIATIMPQVCVSECVRGDGREGGGREEGGREGGGKERGWREGGRGEGGREMGKYTLCCKGTG